jgi:hypothetical protein
MLVSISGLVAFILMHNSNVQAEGTTPMRNQNLLSMISEDTTYEDFSESFQEGLSEETLKEAEDIFNKVKEAITSEDDESLQQLLIQLNSLNLFENSSEGGFGRPDGQDGFNITDVVGDSSNQGGPPNDGGERPQRPDGGS